MRPFRTARPMLRAAGSVVLALTVAGMSGCGASDAARSSNDFTAPVGAASTVAKTALMVPSVGRLTWRCDAARRFSTGFTVASGGATTTARLSVNAGAATTRMMQPGQTWKTSFSQARFYQWNIETGGEAGSTKLSLWIATGVKGGRCLVPVVQSLATYSTNE
jgi:hypothetical protein